MDKQEKSINASFEATNSDVVGVLEDLLAAVTVHEQKAVSLGDDITEVVDEESNPAENVVNVFESNNSEPSISPKDRKGLDRDEVEERDQKVFETELPLETKKQDSFVSKAEGDLLCSIVDVKSILESQIGLEKPSNLKYVQTTTSYGSSTPEFKQSPSFHTYAREITSPMEILVPELDTSADIDSLVSHTGVETDPEIDSGTDKGKFYKIIHRDEVFFLRAELNQHLPVHFAGKINNSPTVCGGCRIEMLDVTVPHECVPSFCIFCQESTSNYELHVIENHTKNLTVCPFCCKDQTSLQLLEAHLSIHTQIKIKPSICNGCKTKFMTSEGRNDHICNVLICKPCNITYATKDKLEEHKKSQHKILTLSTQAKPDVDDGETKVGANVCDFCDKRFETVTQLDSHVSWHLKAPADTIDDLEVIVDLGKASCKGKTEKGELRLEKIRCPHCTIIMCGDKAINEHLILSNFCKHCFKQLGSSHEYESHMVEFHCMEIQCQFCGEDFKEGNDLIQHAKLHTRLEIRPFQCKTCNSRFGKETLKKFHQCQGKKKISKLECIDCRAYFQCRKTFEIHLLTHHWHSSICPICKCSSENLPELLEHVKGHFTSSSQLLVFCSKCMVSFMDEKAFYDHFCEKGFKGFQETEVIEFSSSDEEQMVACNICGKEFSTERELEEHLQQTVSEATQIAKEKLCRHCDVEFAVRSSFEAHIIQRHLSSLQCGFCLKYFASRQAMEQHLLHHTNIHRQPRFCNACAKMFFSEGLYENHSCESANDEDEVQRVDSPTNDPLFIEEVAQSPSRKMHYCPVCNVGFKGKKYLDEIHIPTHAQKVFTCHICLRQLQTVDTLSQHLLCHAEAARAKTSPAKDKQMLPMLVLPQISVPEERNRCWPCRRVFPNEEELAKHQVIHSYSAKVMSETDRRISCKVCRSKFESEIWLAQHYSDKHNIMSVLRYPCNLCYVSFSSLTDRAKHLCRKNSAQVHEIFWERVEIKQETVVKPSPFNHQAMTIDHPCTHCGDNFVNQIALISHQIYERYCADCKIKFSDIDMYQQHRMYNHVTLEFCTFCRQLMMSRVKLIKHLRAHTNLPLRAAESIQGYVFRCRSCKTVFKHKSEYEQHNLENHFLNRKVCPFCHDSFGNHREMASHSKVHCHVRKQARKAKPSTIAQKPAKVLPKPKPRSKQSPAAPAVQQQSRRGPGRPLKKKLDEKSKMPAPAPESQKEKKTEPNVVMKKLGGSSDAVSVASSSKPVNPPAPSPRILVTMNRTSCSACRKYVSSPKVFYEHVLDAHFKNPLQCPFCEKKTKLASHLRGHLVYHQNIFCKPEPIQSTARPESLPVVQPKALPKSNESVASPSLKSVETSSGKCPLCSQNFKSQSQLNGHIRTCHHLEPAKAHLLHKTVSQASSEIVDDAGPDKDTFCRHCHTSFETHAQLRAHAVKAKVFCEFCKITVADTKEYEMHMLEEHPMDDTCQFCGAYIPDKAGLVIHIRKHTSMGPIHYKCFGCNKMFTSCKAKDNHPCVAYACPKCNEPQNGPDGLEEHLQVAHKSPEPKAAAPLKKSSRRPRQPSVGAESTAASAGPEEPPKKKTRSEEESSQSSTRKSDPKKVTSTWNCGHCNGVFASLDSLTRHAIKMKLYCKICKELFPSTENRDSHECATAGKVQKLPSQQQQQIPYVCRFCGDQFNSFQLYESHSKSHVICQCKICFKVFDSLEQMESHHKALHERPARPVIKLESDSDDEITIVSDMSKKPAGAQFVMQ